MLTVSMSIVSGTGTLPKDVSIGSVLLLDASNNIGSKFSWSVLSKPDDSMAVLRSPISSSTKFGPLDQVGVYQIKVAVDEGESTYQQKMLAVSVPPSHGVQPIPPQPEFSGGGGLVRNGTFSLPGILPGWAAYWTIIDDADILSEHAGITRGRCIPTNFDSDGSYVMCLGDDIGLDHTVAKGDEFSVSQTVDFTNATVLRVSIKFIQR